VARGASPRARRHHDRQFVTYAKGDHMQGLLTFSATVIGGWIIFNLIGAFLVGAIARKLFPGGAGVGWFKTLVIGFLGGILGKLVFWLLHWPSGFPMGFVASVAGAFVLLIAYNIRAAAKRGGTK
jgi:uncharacterized membrane protein YeaQ/YmgE (transglycosylase-associated protein family)